MILISGTLSHDWSSHALLCYLPSLTKITEIGSFSWASLGYPDLLSSVRHRCKQLNDQSPVAVYSVWRVVEVTILFLRVLLLPVWLMYLKIILVAAVVL